VFKLAEIDKRYHLINPGYSVVDLGAAPGSWCQYVINKTGSNSKVVAIDLLPMKPIENVNFIQGDFCNSRVVDQILAHMDDRPADLVLSDMAPDLTGIRITDQANMEHLLMNIINSLEKLLRPGANLLIKVFEGQMLADVRKSLNLLFKKVISIKPGASRKQSKEFYLLATQYRPPN
jgi:23S rRNA (uridine2552-2'-O)-methyltransferase